MSGSKSYQLRIPTPCHERWADMMPTERGRFCASCQKEVIDFTGWSDARITDYIDRQGATRVCGRISKAQLKHSFGADSKVSYPNSIFKWPLAAALVVALPPLQGLTQTPISQSPIGSLTKGNKEETPVLKGLVLDQDGIPVNMATVVIESTHGKVLAGLYTDESGSFSFDISNFRTEVIHLRVASFSFYTYRQSIDLKNIVSDSLKIIQLEFWGATLTGEVLIVRSRPSSILGSALWYAKWPFVQVGKLFRRRGD